MTPQRLQELLAGFSRTRILVIGDFFLDKYLTIDTALTETSIETSLDAYQIVAQRVAPGAAGNVVANLHSLQAGTVLALGITGDDGEGYELRQCLQALGTDTSALHTSDGCMTPTYIKPMFSTQGQEQEGNRFDRKNRRPLPSALEDAIIDDLHRLVPQVQAVLITDQVQERNYGVITDRVRAVLLELAHRYTETPFLVDSRLRVGEFTQCWIKPNQFEAYLAVHGHEGTAVTREEATACGRALRARNGQPVFLTLGAEGILAIDDTITHLPTMRQPGPIDICGAGDSTLAGLTLALCSGATPVEAAMIGNLIASLTVQQLGSTGKATPAEIRERFAAEGEQFQPLPPCALQA